MVKEQVITDVVWIFTLIIFSAAYHGMVFLLTLTLSSALGRLLSTFIFCDFMKSLWLSEFYFDALLIVTVFPYILKDMVMRIERHWGFLKEQFFEDISSVARTGHSIIIAFVAAYLLGTSYGLVITTVGQRLEASASGKNLAIMSSPLHCIISTIRTTILGAWETKDQVVGMEGAYDQMIHLQFVFLLSSLFPIYCTVRCFRDYNEEKADVNMRLYLWNFLWSCLSCCGGKDTWTFRRCALYFLAFVYEIVQCSFFLILPLTLAVYLGQSSFSVGLFGKCAVLYSVFTSGSIIMAEDSILSKKMRHFLKDYVQARLLASVLLLYLTSIPVLIMFYSTLPQHSHGSIWMDREFQLMLCASSVAYCAYGCSKITIGKAAFTCSTMTTKYFAAGHECEGTGKKTLVSSYFHNKLMVLVPSEEKSYFQRLHYEEDEELILP